MNAPVRLAKRTDAAASDAFFLPAADARPLAAVAHLSPSVFRVAGGFLLVPPTPTPTADRRPGAVRLRRLRGDLFVPTDADLLPALLPDEQVELTRRTGLVVLPAGAVAFDPAAPLAPADWLAPPPVRRGGWTPFPDPPPRAERLASVGRPPETPAAVLEILSAGRPDDANPLVPGEGVPDDARPPSAGLLSRAAAGAGYAAGGLLAALGRLFRSPGLARRGAELVRKAVERVPRLTERLLGQQEAALRDVLRELMEGNVEKALRRAPIAVADPDAGPGRVGTSADLGSRDPRYSLRSLLGGGAGAAWLGGGDVWQRLADQYRQLAADAVRRGDYRRAAYLHGVLLRDPRAAAAALMQGGLYRDAGVLYRDKVRDLPLAARAFELAGDPDEAVRLYERAEQYEPAGDLLARLGETDRAVELFRRAGFEHARRNHFLQAGDLMRTKAGDAAEANEYYRLGWNTTGADAVPCGERLLDAHLVAEDWEAADILFAQAEFVFAPPRASDAGRFFGYAREVGTVFLPPPLRDDLADRTRLLFASHVRAAGNPGKVAGELFGPSGKWPGPVARDAAFAAGKGRSAGAVGHPPPVPLAAGEVTAVAVAWGSFDVLVATTQAVVFWRPADGKVEHVCATNRPVTGLSTDYAGRWVIVQTDESYGRLLRCYARERERFFPAGQRTVVSNTATEDVYLQPAAMMRGGELSAVVGTPRERFAVVGVHLRSEPPAPLSGHGVPTHLIAEGGAGYVWDWRDRGMSYQSPSGEEKRCWPTHWTPARPPGSTLATTALDWTAHTHGTLEVVGTDGDGFIHWDRFAADGPYDAAFATDGRYVAACLSGPGRVYALDRGNQLHAFRISAGRFDRLSARPLVVPARAVAVVARPPAGEVVVVLADGSAVRVADG